MRPKLSPLRCGCVFSLVLSALWFFPQITHAQAPSAQAFPPTQTERPPNRSSWANQPKYKSDQILVRFRPGTSAARVGAIHAASQSEKVRTWNSVEGLQLVRLPAGTAVRDALKTYRNNPEVLYAEPNYLVHALTGPNDPKFPHLWGLQNTGQMGGTAGADIHAAQAWGLTTGSSNALKRPERKPPE